MNPLQLPLYRGDIPVSKGFEHPWDHMHEDHGPTYKFVPGDDDEETKEEEEEEAEDEE